MKTPGGVGPTGLYPNSAADYPVPLIDQLSKPFWNGVTEGRLIIQECKDCGFLIHWPKWVCPACLSMRLGSREVSGKGWLYSYTIVEHSYHPGLSSITPYILAVVELSEQKDLKLVTRLIDVPTSQVRADMAVECRFTEVAPGLTLPLFTRADDPARVTKRLNDKDQS
jgi:uncharacterized protein